MLLQTIKPRCSPNGLKQVQSALKWFKCRHRHGLWAGYLLSLPFRLVRLLLMIRSDQQFKSPAIRFWVIIGYRNSTSCWKHQVVNNSILINKFDRITLLQIIILVQCYLIVLLWKTLWSSHELKLPKEGCSQELWWLCHRLCLFIHVYMVLPGRHLCVMSSL